MIEIQQKMEQYTEEQVAEVESWIQQVLDRPESEEVKLAWGLRALKESTPDYDALVAELGDPMREPVIKPKPVKRGQRKHTARRTRKQQDQVLASTGGTEVVDSPETGSTGNEEE